MNRSASLMFLCLVFLIPTARASAYFAEDFAPDVVETIVTPSPAITVPAVYLPAADTLMTRGTFTAMVVERLYDAATIDHCYWDIGFPLPPRFTLVFSDVSVDHPYAKHLCIAMRDGLIRGYGDGTFRPDALINAAEASKILARAFALAPYADAQTHGIWHTPYVSALTDRHVIPAEITTFSQHIPSSVGIDMFDRLFHDLTDRPTYNEEGSLTDVSVMRPAPMNNEAPH